MTEDNEAAPRLALYTSGDPDRGWPAMTAARFEELRAAIGTQVEVCAAMKTTRRTLGRWERGERPIPGVAGACIELLYAQHLERRARTAAAIMEMDPAAAAAIRP